MSFKPLRFRIPTPPLLQTTIRTLQILTFAHLVSTSFIELRQCTGFSMLPTISHYGDWVLVSPLPYWSRTRWSREPSRGDLVFASSPVDPRQTVCKRVIGVGGDLVEVEPRREDGAGRRWVGMGGILDVEGGVGEVDDGGIVAKGDLSKVRRKGEEQWIRIPKGHVWLAGDNTSNSTDSRMYGPVPLAMIKGQVLAKVSKSHWVDVEGQRADGLGYLRSIRILLGLRTL